MAQWDLTDPAHREAYLCYSRAVRRACNITRAAWHYWCKGGEISSKYLPIIDTVTYEIYGFTVFGTETAEEGGQP